ncbi:MAG: hypothetical protein IJO46_15330, partial [Thermoguttaceae bacterium]|nr:hypothetical protein [Thermoguttaceae bacterium]
EFRREFFRLDADARAALTEEMKSGALSEESRKRPAAAKAFAKQSEWLEVEKERAALRKLRERFDVEIARAESERARWSRRLESEETLGAAVDELDAELGNVEAVAVVDRLTALTEDAANEANRPLDAISPDEALALEKTKESALDELLEGGKSAPASEGGEAGDGEKIDRVAANAIPALPRFDSDAVADDAPVRRRLFESEGEKIVETANREIKIALDAGAVDVAFAATNDAAAELVKLAETLAKDRVDEFKKFQETARRASWRPTLDALRETTNELAGSNADWEEAFALLEEAVALAPLAQIAEVDKSFAQNLTDLQDLARYYEATDESAGAAVRRRLDALLGKTAEETTGEALESASESSFFEFFDDETPVGGRAFVVGPILWSLCALCLGAPVVIGVLIFYFATRSRNGGTRWERGGYERRFPVPESRSLPNGALSGRNWQIIGLVFLIGLITAGPFTAAVAAFIAALICAGRFGTALGALGILAFLIFAFVLIALATALAIVVSIFVF